MNTKRIQWARPLAGALALSLAGIAGTARAMEDDAVFQTTRIEVDAGREIDVVLTKGVRIEGSEASTASNSPSSLPGHSDHAERYLKVTTEEE